MTTMELVRHRRSVRTFDGNGVPKEDLNALLAYANAVENPYGLPITWKIMSAKEYGLSSPVIAGTDLFIAGKIKKVPHAEEAFGYAFEKVVLKAEAMGLGTTWIAGTMNRPAFEKAMELAKDEAMPCVSPLGVPAAKMSLKEIMMRKGVRADYRMPFNEVFFEGDLKTPLTEEKAGKLDKERTEAKGGSAQGSLYDALEMARLAPSAVNKQPWRLVVCGDLVHFYEKRSKGYVGADGWDLQKIDMGIAMCHFAEGIPGTFEIQDPGIAIDEDCQYITSYRIG